MINKAFSFALEDGKFFNFCFLHIFEVNKCIIVWTFIGVKKQIDMSFRADSIDINFYVGVGLQHIVERLDPLIHDI